MDDRTLTAVPGVEVGHAGDREAATGCTVVLGPFAAAVEVVGLATGTRELDALSLLHLVPACDAILLTGGSAFGLGAADGVVAWLEERGRGFETRAARVPIVPAAVLYDLGVGRSDVRPGPAMGRAAAEAAGPGPVAEGRVGAGTGATVGKLLGYGSASPGGVGSWAEPAPDRDTGAQGSAGPEGSGRGPPAGRGRVAALAVVNAFGDVLDGRGRILAGSRGADGGFADTARLLRRGAAFPAAGPGESTTLAVVATDLPLDKRELRIVARQAAGALYRRLSPAGSPFDGDLVFAVSTGSAGDPGGAAGPDELLSIGERARAVLETAIERAVSRSAPRAGGREDREGDGGGARGGA